VTPAEILRELEELDHRLERLRIKYDQFFTGTEKALPYVLRKDIDRRFQALHREQMRNTGARFRFLFMRADGAQLAELCALVDAGTLRPLIHRTYPFAETAEAFAELERGRARGKIVVELRPPA